MENITDINTFVERLHSSETWGDAYDLFKYTDSDIITRFVEAGEDATKIGFQLTMRDQFFINQAKARADINQGS